MSYLLKDFDPENGIEIDEWDYIPLRSGKTVTIHLGKTEGNKASLVMMPYDEDEGTLVDETIAVFSCDYINPKYLIDEGE